MSEGYEYVAVTLSSRNSKDRDRELTAALNEVAQHGWRLCSTLSQDGLHPPFAIFERAVEWESPE